MLNRFLGYAKEQDLFPAGKRVLLAVSGGRDSMCLAHLVHAAGIPFAIAHCNFHLRPGDCDRDQQFVRRHAESLGVPFHTVDFDTIGYAREHGQSEEMAARQLRYRWFATLCGEHGYPCVATAHHRDDSIETFFLNLFRGTGIAGLRGILPRSSFEDAPRPLTVVHPMLCFSRAEIDAYIGEQGIPYVEDCTNAQPIVRRNQVRLHLLPLLRQLYPAFDSSMEENMRHLNDTWLIYRSAIAAFGERLVQPLPPQLVTTPCPMVAIPLADIPEPRDTILFELLRPYGYTISTVESLLKGTHASGRLFRSRTHLATTVDGRLVVAPQCAPVEPTISEAPGICLDDPRTVTVDDERMRRPLRVRPWREGDRFCPFGMQQQRKVSDYLKDRKINRIEKQYVYLLTDADDRIVWVVGLCLDNRFRITADTRTAVHFSV